MADNSPFAQLERQYDKAIEEIAKLRVQLAAVASEATERLRDEVSAHEATKARYQTARAQANEASRRVSAAEARVAELEAIKPLLDGEALNQARGLLERAPRWLTYDGPARDLRDDIYNWLRSHPATEEVKKK